MALEVRYLILASALTGAALLALVILKPFGGSDGADDALQPLTTGGNICDRPLPALGSGQITQEQFDAADAGLGETIRLAEEGDVPGASIVFTTDVHDFTHDVDAPLRDAEEELAKRLCNAVAQIEAEIVFRADAAMIAEEAEGIRDLLRQAAEELGFAPGGR